MMQVANPIYDSAFKYLMEDLDVARTFISALLQKNVVKVEMRNNEYSNIQKNGISIMRIDFGATVLEDDGKEHVVLIELQKAWVETEILRFRQYLGAQYGNPANIYSLEDDDDERNGYGIPIVSVYLLGHRIGKVKEPIIYIRRNYLSYDNEAVVEGVPDPFVESLTHDSVVVQIPLLTGMMRNRLEHLLNVFDQSRRTVSNRQVLEFNEQDYVDDPEVQRILSRLMSAVSDTKVRMDMNIEDEIQTSLSNRDRKIMKRDATIREQAEELSKKNELLSQKDEQLSQKDEQLSQKDEQLSQKEEQLRASILMLLSANFPVEVIAHNLNVSEEEVRKVEGSR